MLTPSAPVEFQPVDIDEVLERSLVFMDEQLSQCSIEVTLDLDPAPLVVDGNALELERAFTDLLTKAVVNAERKAIDVVTRRIEGCVMVLFRDSERDVIVTTSARRIIRDHGGSISVVGRPGEEAALSVELPLIDVEVVGPAARPAPSSPST